MFKWAEEEPKGSPLFAAALAGAAAGAGPLSMYLNQDLLIPSMKGIDDDVVHAAGELNKDQVKALKAKMLDSAIRDKVLVVQGGGPSFNPVTKKYLPKRKELEEAIRKGGLQTFEGTADPIKAIEAIRESGGFVRLPGKGANAIQLAHELGHATTLNSPATIRNTAPYRFLDSMGRRLVNSGSRGAIASALLAGSFSSDDENKWIVPGALAATQVPLLAEEATASFKALSALNALKDAPSGAMNLVGEESKLLAPAILENAGKSLRRAWGTYGLGAAGLLAAPLLAIKAREQWDTRDRD